MKVTRSNMFETNSSSVHAIVVKTKEDMLMVPKDKEICFCLAEFGWEKNTYVTIEDRAAYLWTAICDRYNGEDDLIISDWRDYIRKTVKEFDPEIDVAFQKPKENDFFYVDHSYELTEWLEGLRSNPNDLEKFLFGRYTEIRTGNDNNEKDYPDTSAPGPDYSVYVK